MSQPSFAKFGSDYLQRLALAAQKIPLAPVEELANAMLECWRARGQLFIANDEGYEHIFAHQLAVLAESGDLALAFSGSGNSPNVLRALEFCKQKGVRSFAVLGYSGGKAKALADVPIHVAIDDMQISEDLQLVVGHMLMQWLYEHRDQVK